MANEQRRAVLSGDEYVICLKLVDVPLITGTGTILREVSAPFHGPFVPASMRRTVFQTLHGISHPGIPASQKHLTERFFWPGMNKDVKAWAPSCLRGQCNKVQRHIKSPPGTFLSPVVGLSCVHLDVAGLLPLPNIYTHLLAGVDRYTRWAEANLLPIVQAETVVRVFVGHRIATFRAPSTARTDHAAHVESVHFRTFLHFLGCTGVQTRGYNPAANEMAERYQRHPKTILRAAEDRKNWPDNLSIALLSIHAELNPDLDCSEVELVLDATPDFQARWSLKPVLVLRRPLTIFCTVCGNLYARFLRFRLERQRPSLMSKKVRKTALMRSFGVTGCVSRWNNYT
nr:unnamed protein product [Spirometra erinaceieuropaei]